MKRQRGDSETKKPVQFSTFDVQKKFCHNKSNDRGKKY